MVDKLLKDANERLDEWQDAIRDTPRRGPVLLSTGRSVGWHEPRVLSDTAWDRIDADWARQYPVAEPVKGEAVAA